MRAYSLYDFSVDESPLLEHTQCRDVECLAKAQKEIQALSLTTSNVSKAVTARLGFYCGIPGAIATFRLLVREAEPA